MKTYYSVQYRALGMMAPGTEWFDDLEEAKEFAAQDYRDNVIVHNIKNPDRIAEIEVQIAFRKNGGR